MTDWHDLVVAATVGTASRPVDLAATPDAVRTAAPPTADAAGSLLDAAVAFTVVRRAGPRATPGEVPPPAPDDPRPAVSALAADLLRLVLVDRELDLVQAVLGEIAAAGRRLPDPLVPTVLALASRHSVIRPRTLEVCGPVAGWLAARNPAWAWARSGGAATVQTFDPAVWETADRAGRVAQVRALRRADPAAASAMLHASWPSTAPDERVDLLAVLGPSAVATDEPLLEATLDDRRAEVRRLAAELLGRLEGSDFRRRATERAHGLVGVERRGLRRVLVVTAPEPFDAAARRDGLQEAPGAPRALGAAAVAGVGPVAARVRQVVAAAPLTLWPELTGLAPDQLAGATVDGFGGELLAGWVDAAVRDRDVRWAGALLGAARNLEPVQRRRAQLVAVLPPDQLARTVAAALADDRLDGAAEILAAASVPWDPPVVTAFARWWRRAARSVPGRELLAVLPLAGRGLPATTDHAALLREAAERASDGAIWMRSARAAAETIDLRRRLHEELR